MKHRPRSSNARFLCPGLFLALFSLFPLLSGALFAEQAKKVTYMPTAKLYGAYFRTNFRDIRVIRARLNDKTLLLEFRSRGCRPYKADEVFLFWDRQYSGGALRRTRLIPAVLRRSNTGACKKKVYSRFVFDAKPLLPAIVEIGGFNRRWPRKCLFNKIIPRNIQDFYRRNKDCKLLSDGGGGDHGPHHGRHH